MTKILYLYENLGIGGAEQLLLTTLKYLDRNKFMPVIYYIGNDGKIAKEIEEKLKIKAVSLNRKAYLWSFWIIFDLVKIFKNEKPKIVHTHLFYANYFGRIAAILAGVPVIIMTEHGAHSSFKKFYHHWIDFILSFFSSKIIAVSESVRRYLIEHSLIFSHKIKVIHNAVDFDNFERIKQTNRLLMRRNLGIHEAGFLIGCVSKLSACKGQRFLIEALSEIKKYFPGVKLCIAGWDTGGFQQQLERLAEAKGIKGDVLFLGERRDVPEILSAFDLFILPSLSEGFGLSLIEAMYAGLPVVAASIDGILEIIEDKKDGFLVPPADSRLLAAAVVELLSNSNLRETLGRNAKEKVERLFSPVDYINKLESCYYGLLK